MVATGETVGLAEWIIDDTCLVDYYRLPATLELHVGSNSRNPSVFLKKTRKHFLDRVGRVVEGGFFSG